MNTQAVYKAALDEEKRVSKATNPLRTAKSLTPPTLPAPRRTRAHLQPSFHPIQLRTLEKLGGLQRPEQILLLQRFGLPMVKLVQHVVLEQLLIRHPYLHRIV